MRTLFNRLGWVMAGVVSLLVVAAITGIVRAGPLDPPGPPGSTDSVRLPGTPITSIPYTISQPGTYYLTRNVSRATSGDGITLAADNVTIDLMGFTISGPGASFTGNGITDGGLPHQNVTVKNGALVSWPGDAIHIYATFPGRYEDLTLKDSGGGLMLASGPATARNIIATNITSTSIQVPSTSHLDGCTITGWGSIGVSTGDDSVVSKCTVLGATTGIQLGFGSTLSNCSVENGVTGISAGVGSVVQSCSVYNASGPAVQLAAGAQLSDCAIYGGGTAMWAFSGSTVRNCALYSTANGISAAGADIEDNSIETVTGVGACAISLSGGGGRARGNKIRGAANGICSSNGANLVYQNTFDGIGSAFLSGPMTSAPMDYPATFGNAQANVGY